ncbi:MAG: Fructose-1,6-bisphosphate aldolase, class II [Parcubacteria group bacterium GW2011_GWA2_47_26]|nr:MAG: Fructose-1,6-bisphosphate aldolase, class II [Parcubacteria group bacterium GW2011_GWA2_47_26]
MLTTLKSVLAKANRENYAVGAFNINDLEILQAVMDAAIAEKAPVILQTSAGAIEYAGMEELAALVHIEVKKTRVPVVFHLDHGKNIALVKQAIKSGYYTSAMYDGSALPFKDNVRTTKEIVKLAHAKNISVEAELGAIAGIEDFVSVKEREACFTDSTQAAEFVRETHCDALAIAIGTAHGAYKFKGAPRLDLERLKKIKTAVKIPLVLHGASGVPQKLKQHCLRHGCKIREARGISDALIKKAVKFGINKINIDTDLRLAFTVGVRHKLKESPETIDPRKILGEAKKVITQVAREKIRLLGCAQKA